MAELLSTETFDPNSPASRVARLEALLNHKDFRWFLEQLRKKEAAGVANCCSVHLSAEDRTKACHQLAGLREAINYVEEELDVAVKHLKEEIRKDDPNTPKPQPVL